MVLTYYGHSCFLVEISGKRILFDPFIRPNPLAAAIDVKSLKADYILVTHGHWDHVADLIEIAKQTNAIVVSNFEIIEWIKKAGITNTHAMNIGGHWIFDFGKIKCVNAVHSSSLPDGSYGGNAMGFLVESEDFNFYYAGDTALHLDMKLIGDFKKMHYTFLPIGNNYTMGIDNAVIASDFIRCDKVIGMHFDTFDHIKIEAKEAKTKFELSGKELFLLSVGETREI